MVCSRLFPHRALSGRAKPPCAFPAMCAFGLVLSGCSSLLQQLIFINVCPDSSFLHADWSSSLCSLPDNCPDQHNPLPQVALVESLAECVGWGQWTPTLHLGVAVSRAAHPSAEEQGAAASLPAPLSSYYSSTAPEHSQVWLISHSCCSSEWLWMTIATLSHPCYRGVFLSQCSGMLLFSLGVRGHFCCH